MKPILLLLGSLLLLMLVFLSGVIITANVIAEPEPHRFANINAPDLWTSQPKEVDPARQAYQRLPDARPPQTAAAEAPKPAAPVGRPASETAAASQTMTAPIDHTVTASVQPSVSAPASGPETGNTVPPVQPQNANVDAARAQFCYARYRSYRVEDNSYQPFDGGPRRQCQAPGATQAEATAPAARDVASAPPVSPSRSQESYRQSQAMPPEAIPTDDEGYLVEPGYDEPQTVNSAAPAGSHEEWCANRYRSYRADDNSYQPFDGSPRRVCQSPFG